MSNTTPEHADVAILGSGPAGMQAALVTSRTRKKVVVFDDPEPPRNGASHGVHNFLGLENLLPAEIRETAWEQINAYQSAELREERVADVHRLEDRSFILTGAEGTELRATKIIVAVGYDDVYPNVPGFAECWAKTIIPCPFCDGYENRDRVWGIVPGSEKELNRFPKMAKNWTAQINLFLSPSLEIDPAYQDDLAAFGITIYEGSIKEVLHSKGDVDAVRLDTGASVNVGTLLWVPPTGSSPLIENLVRNLGLIVDESGYVKTDDMQQTNVDGLWAAGEVKECCSSGIESAAAGCRAAFALIRDWYR